MSTRYIYFGVFILLILTLITCAVNSRRHYKELGKAVSWLDIALIPPILGNAIIIIATRKWLALIGCYIYYIGMDFVVYELMKFTEAYCNGAGREKKAPKWIKWVLIADAAQLLINPLTKHAFDIEWIVQKGQIYYILKPLTGQYVHRLVVYGVFIAVILTLAVTTVHTSRLYRETYNSK